MKVDNVVIVDFCYEDMYAIYYYCLYFGKDKIISFPKRPTSWSYSISDY